MSVRKVAELAGVSPSTVSRALRDDPHVSPETRRRVHEAAAACGYDGRAPHAAAERGGLTRPWPAVTREAAPAPATGALPRTAEMVIFGARFPVIESPFFGEIFESARAALAAHGCSLGALNIADYEDWSDAQTRLLAQPAVEAYILGWADVPRELMRRLEARGTPCVLVGPDTLDVVVNLVDVDEWGGAYALARHLITAGRRRFAYIAGLLHLESCQRKLAGCRAALAEHGLELPQNLVEQGIFTIEGGFAAMQRLLERGEIDAVLTSNDYLALGAVRAAQERGLQVPEQLAVTGFDDVSIAAFASPALTTARVPRAAIGEAAAEILIQSCLDPGRVRKVIFRPELVVRASCGGAAPNLKPAPSPL